MTRSAAGPRAAGRSDRLSKASRSAALGEGLEPLGESTGVGLLGPGQRLEPLCDLLQAFVTGGLGEPGVHLGVLVGLALDGRLEVVRSRTDRDPGHRVADLLEEVEVPERVAGLTFGDRAEQCGNVGVALDVGLLCEVQVTAIGLALAGERRFKLASVWVPFNDGMVCWYPFFCLADWS